MNIATTDKNITTEIDAFIRLRMPDVSDPVRTSALEIFRQLGLPHAKHEEYKYTPISRELEKNFSFTSQDTRPYLGDIKEFQIPDLDGHVLVFINGAYSPEHSRVDESEKLTVRPLADVLQEKNTTAVEHFNQHINMKSDALTAWNTAGWTSGVFVHVPDNTAVKKPLVFYYVNDASATEVVSTHRNLFVLGKSSNLVWVEKFNSSGPGNHFTNLVNEVVVRDHASLDYYSIQNDKGNRYQFTQTEIYQRDNSRVNTFTFNFQGKLLRNNLHLIIDGEGIESHMYGLYLLGGTTLADNHTVVDHKKPNSMTNELFKGIMDDSSKGVFNGKIFVRPLAQKTNAFQANRNILLSEKAGVYTKPQLEIWADDVKCSHGCTTGQLDEEALFYLRARGIDRDTARAMMLNAFAGEVTEKIPHEGIKRYIDIAISERLQKRM